METVNNIASAASKAIWGETATNKDEKTTTSGQEPVSGELGNVKAGEPYDKGNEETTSETISEPKSLTKTSSKEIPSSDSTANLPSTAAHTTPLLPEPAHEKKTETSGPTEITLPKDQKTDDATKAAIVKLEQQAKELKVSDGESAEKGDGLVSAKKVGEGEGVNTGVKSSGTEGVHASKEPASVIDSAKKTVAPTPAAKTKSGNSSSSSSGEEVEGGGKKKKLSMKEKIKAKLHKH